MRCPSILGCDPKEARRRWRRALVKEQWQRLSAPVIEALPEYLNGIGTLLAVMAIIAGIMAVMTAI